MSDEANNWENLELWRLIRRVHRAIEKARSFDLNKKGLSISKFAVLGITKQLGLKTTSAILARRMGRRPHSISQLLVKMEEQGLITKSKDLPRKNMFRISITEKGEEILQTSIEELEILNDIFSVLSDANKEVLRNILSDVLSRVTDILYHLQLISLKERNTF